MVAITSLRGLGLPIKVHIFDGGGASEPALSLHELCGRKFQAVANCYLAKF